MSPRAVRELQFWLDDRCHITPKPGEDDYLFLSFRRRQHLSRITVFHTIQVLAARAGITRPISPHTLRHTFATHALTSGVDAKTLSGILGHTNASFTLDTYTHVTSDMQKTASGIVGGFMEDIFGKELKPWQENEKPATEP